MKRMHTIKKWLLGLAGLAIFAATAQAHINPNHNKQPRPNNNSSGINYRENCAVAVNRIDQAINNVRARLTTGGDVWWDGNNGIYVVPKVPAGVPPVSAIFAGAVWLGGVDPGGSLKLAAQTYGRGGGEFDFYPGPIDPETGQTTQERCSQWDKFFVVTGAEIDQHLANYNRAKLAGVPYDPALIPRGVKGWPALGNQYFFDVHLFDLPTASQGLAGYWDEDGDGTYSPEGGDYPVIEIRGCTDNPQYPDEMIFWIYNDAGNTHNESNGDKIQMEVQVQAFAYVSSDQLNDMTFQRYKLINRAVESIDSTFFAMWVDPDLGCHLDDYVGCDTLRSLAYVYNEDSVDGSPGTTCPSGNSSVNTYGESVPILGVDYFRGPTDENGKELGMSSFTYYNNNGIGSPPPGTTDPGNAVEYYRYLTGSWRDGSPFTYGGDAYQEPTQPLKYAFTEPPSDPTGWSMCTAGLPFGDRRTIQASGPFRLDPGAVNELIIGVVWVPDQVYPCPNIRKLQDADDISQGLFDACFDQLDGPDAPDIDFIELDREIIAVFTNDTVSSISNNAYEAYAEAVPGIGGTDVEDSLYVFEGYKLFQFSGPDVGVASLDDPTKARLIYQVDINNDVSRIFNWEQVEVDNANVEEYYVPVLEVEGANQGIRHTFRITEDQFASGDRRLVNHKKYYFVAVAYGHNNYLEFNPLTIIGQRKPYLQGRRNVGDKNGNRPFYTVIPRPIVDRRLNAEYGEGAIITRIDGVGTGTNFLDIDDDTRADIESGIKGTPAFEGEITYRAGRGPIQVNVFNPLDVIDGEYELTFVDENMANNKLDNIVRWTLKSLTDPSQPILTSQNTIEFFNEEIVKQYGFTVNIGQVKEPGVTRDVANGIIGYEEEYLNSDATPWLNGIPDEYAPSDNPLASAIFNYVRNRTAERDFELDPKQAFSQVGPGYFLPYRIANWFIPNGDPDIPFLTPAWQDRSNANNIVRNQTSFADLNNVDIVFTSNRDLWSRCVVIETANLYYQDAGLLSEGERKPFDLRNSPSVSRDDLDNDGKPDPDGDGEGMGWFPGYAIDVETGQRLNIFFGENSAYDGSLFPESYNELPTGRDMMFNPTSQEILNTAGGFGLFNFYMGGQHFIYVTKQAYDGCAFIRTRLTPGPIGTLKVNAVREITWTGFPMLEVGQRMKAYKDGLIPEDLVVKLRATNPYAVRIGTGEFNGYPTYRFKIEGKQASALTAPEVETALDMINVVPNPYYGYSNYETSAFETTVKISNLPAKCVVSIYTLDGKFIRQYVRDEIGGVPLGSNRAISRTQISPDLEWDLKNSKGIPIASGVYLIHVAAEGLGERTIKWFGVSRKFDPSGL